MEIYKKILIIIAACIASAGTFPYAWQFASTLFTHPVHVFFFQILFSTTAVFANAGLGAFSLYDSIRLKNQLARKRLLMIGTLCFCASIPLGFISYVGYEKTLAHGINVFISVTVVLVNACIGLSAINRAIDDAYNFCVMQKKQEKRQKNMLRALLNFIFICFALTVTLPGFFASSNGLHQIADSYELYGPLFEFSIYVFSFIVWLPSAILFTNGSRITLISIYDYFAEAGLDFHQLSMQLLLIALIAIPAGSAYAQILLEFFDENKQIPEFFKILAQQKTLIFYFLMPLAFFISAAVNCYALKNVTRLLLDQKK